MYGKLVPTINSVSHSSMASCDGAVPKTNSSKSQRVAIWDDTFAEQSLHDRRAQRFRHLNH